MKTTSSEDLNNFSAPNGNQFVARHAATKENKGKMENKIINNQIEKCWQECLKPGGGARSQATTDGQTLRGQEDEDRLHYTAASPEKRWQNTGRRG